ncbi:MAG TPA: type VI secretion system membrane subunit TssM [Polyangiaceae bacterium]|nr:type VI secretion system membrane subunit TssM [Polyangiaceae bacterium]
MLWLAIACVFLSALSWAVVLLLKLSLWIAVLVTALSILVFLTVLLVRQLRAAGRARALERELLRLATAQASQVRPDRRPEIIALREQMKTAIAGLKRSKLGGKGGSAALYALPWYAIVGPPAAGKTTALEKSGLSFAAPPGTGGAKVRGTAGTRNCDWWFSRDAILLDTAGRFTTAEDDQEEWFVFLDTVRKFRPDRPLDGLVVGVSIESLQAAVGGIEELATKIRARIDEVMTRLEMVLPIYVLFTKLDLVSGFVEFWGDLSKAERAQAWGATFDLDDARLAEPGNAVQGEFDVLGDVIHARMLTRLAHEAVPEVRGKILEFPLAFDELRGPVGRFIDELCRVDPYHESPILRGFYFSSGTQTGVSMDRVLANMSRGFDLRAAAAPDPKRAREPHSYFITELFEKVIFPDRHLGMQSSARVRRRTTQQILLAAAALTITSIAVLPAMVSFAGNRDLLVDTETGVSRARVLEASPNTTAAAVDLLLSRVSELEGSANELKIPGFWGPRVAPELLQAVRAVYLERLRAIVDGPVQAELTADVRAIGSLVRTDAENFKSAYDDLKLYLMLTRPEHLDVGWATPKLTQVWLHAMGGQGGSSPERVEAHARRFLDGLAANASWAWAADPSLVARAQGRLGSQPLDELRYGWLVEKTKDVPPIKPSKIFFGPSAQYFSARDNVEVRGLYTAAGWAKVKVALASSDAEFNLEPWVLGKDLASVNHQVSDATRLQDLYFERYVRAWSDFIGALSVAAAPDIRAADDELRTLTEANGPYIRLFRTVSENTTLDLTPTSTLDKALEVGKDLAAKAVPGLDAGVKERSVSSVERYFQPLIEFASGDASKGKDAPPSGLSQYLAQLTTLEVALSQLAESQAAPDASFATELSRTASAVQRLLGGLDSRTRMLVEPLLMTPIRGSRAGVFKADDSALSDRWKAEVWETWNTKLAPRFPFAETGGDVSLAEFSDFFRPQSGLLWKFFERDLSARLERSGDKFVPKAAAVPSAFLPAFLNCINVAQQITDAIFGTLPEAKVPFSINVHSPGSDISQITLRIDGVPTVYKNEAEHWQLAQWPGAGPTKGAALEVKASGFTDEIPREGDFGLFRLLLAGGIKPAGTSQESMPIFVSTWNLNRPGSPPVTIELKPSKATQPFGRGFFARMRCPQQVMAAAPEGPQ